jgi:hypothetical protein
VRRLMALVAMSGLCVAATEELGQAAAGSTDWNWLIVADGPTAAGEREAVTRALRLLSALPARVAILDAERAQPDVRPVLLRLDAFVVKGRPEVYIVRQSELLKCAIRQAPLCSHALAAVIWHEMAHVAGADEREARKREEAQWTTFIRDQQVDPVSALRYLEAMAARPDDYLLASR